MREFFDHVTKFRIGNFSLMWSWVIPVFCKFHATHEMNTNLLCVCMICYNFFPILSINLFTPTNDFYPINPFTWYYFHISFVFLKPFFFIQYSLWRSFSIGFFDVHNQLHSFDACMLCNIIAHYKYNSDIHINNIYFRGIILLLKW